MVRVGTTAPRRAPAWSLEPDAVASKPVVITRNQRVTVPFEYPVTFTRDAFGASPTLLEALTRKEPARKHRALVVVDRGVAEGQPDLVARITAHFAGHAGRVALAAAPVVVVGGEEVKTAPEHLAQMLQLMHDLRLDRHSFVVVVGGGAVLDMVGYAAAITHRGVRVVRLPTTVLSQADSGVGVKNGVNAFGKKNYLGTFAPPYAVINDEQLLESLSARDRIAGMAEAVKVALVRDAQFFGWLGRRADALRRGDDAADLRHLVRTSAELHLNHIATSGDPFELGSARPLDFGHWAAHKLETLSGHRLRHGEAVAIGMALDALYSVSAGLAEAALAAEVIDMLERLGFALWDDELESPQLFDGIDEFREHLGGELTVTLLESAGHGLEVHELRRDLVELARDTLRARARSAA
jgi:3-dehydroquinate synthase